MIKEDLGINGDHKALGRELGMFEFKGFTVAKIDSIEKTLLRIEKRFDNNEKDIGELKEFKTQIWSIAIVIGVIVSVIASFGNLAVPVILKFLGG